MTRKRIQSKSRGKRRRWGRSRAAEEALFELIAKRRGVERADLAGQRFYIRKGYHEWQRRDDLIRSEHRKDIEGGVPKMRSMRILARMFKLSVKRIQAIIYKT